MVPVSQESGSKTATAGEPVLGFGLFRLEAAKRLWQGDQLVELRPRPLAVLRYLAERPGWLVTKDELLKQLWPGIYVTKTVLKVCVREIRQALAEDATRPQFVETVGTQGYRFIGTVQGLESSVQSPASKKVRSSESGVPSTQPLTPSTQMEAEECFHKA